MAAMRFPFIRTPWRSSQWTSLPCNAVRTFHHRCRTYCTANVRGLPRNPLRMCQLSSSLGVRSYAIRHDSRMEENRQSDSDEEGSLESVTILKQFRRLNDEYVTSLVEDMVKGGDIEMTSEDWQEIDAKITENFDEKSVFGKFWATQLMGLFHGQRFFKRSKSLLDYVTVDKAHVSVLKHFLELCVKQEDSEQTGDIHTIYDLLKPKTDMLDYESLTSLLTAVCKTEKWRDSKDLLKVIETHEAPIPHQFSAIARAAIKAGDFETFEDILDQMGEKCEVPNAPKIHVYQEILRSKDFESSYKMLQLLFRYMKKYAWYLPRPVAVEMKEWFENNKIGGMHWKVKMTKVSRRGVCDNCQQEMEKTHISDEDFNELRDTFVKKSLIGKDVFINTTPDELKEFQAFVEKNGPYDVVIDGLNVIYRTKAKRIDYNQLLTLIQECYERRRKSLVLMRSHAQSRWQLKKIQQVTDVFFANNLSSDDPFLLYGALYSGKNTRIITSDEMRDHRFLLGKKMAQVFKVWQWTNQIMFLGTWLDGAKKGQARLKFPPKHQVSPQECDGGWHIPYEDGSERASFECPNTWLCVQRVDGR